MSGHHDHPGDSSHSHAQKIYYKTLRSNIKIGDPRQFCVLMNENLRNYNFHWQLGFLNFSEIFKGKVNSIPKISGTHIARFTTKGVKTKGSDITKNFGEWRTQDDSNLEADGGFKVFKGEEKINFEIRLPFPKLKQELLEKIDKIVVPKNSEFFWDSLKKGGVGTVREEILNPPCFNFTKTKNYLEYNSHCEKNEEEVNNGEEEYLVEQIEDLQVGRRQWNLEVCYKIQQFGHNLLGRLGRLC
jgi:hypothetical protein